MAASRIGRVCGERSPRRRWSRHSAGTTLRCVAAAVMVATVVVAVPATAVAQSEGFSDVTEGVHKPAIDALAERGVFEGTLCGEDMFCPGEPIKRSEMAVWLIRALGDEELPAAGTTRFGGVDADAWWAPHVERLAELEITVGCSSEPLSYCPQRPVSRGQMATFLVRAFDLDPAEPAGFADTEDSTHEASIDALAAAEITVGCNEDPLRFCTGDPVERSQMATFLARALGLIETPSPTPAGTGGDQDAQDTDDQAAEATVDEPSLPPNAYRAVSAGTLHTCGLRVNGTVNCWGDDSRGQSIRPKGTFTAVTGGRWHSCGVRTDDTVACWGNNNHGRTDAPDGTYSAVSAGAEHSCGVRTDDTITCWGNNNHGRTDAPDGTYSAVSAVRA